MLVYIPAIEVSFKPMLNLRPGLFDVSRSYFRKIRRVISRNSPHAANPLWLSSPSMASRRWHKIESACAAAGIGISSKQHETANGSLFTFSRNRSFVCGQSFYIFSVSQFQSLSCWLSSLITVRLAIFGWIVAVSKPSASSTTCIRSIELCCRSSG